MNVPYIPIRVIPQFRAALTILNRYWGCLHCMSQASPLVCAESFTPPTFLLCSGHLIPLLILNGIWAKPRAWSMVCMNQVDGRAPQHGHSNSDFLKYFNLVSPFSLWLYRALELQVRTWPFSFSVWVPVYPPPARPGWWCAFPVCIPRYKPGHS